MNIISDGIGDELQGFVGCGESGSSSGRLLITCKSRRSVLRRIRNIPIGLFPQCYSSSVPPWLHRLILLPWVLYGILQRCDLVQTLQREVSWRWRPPSISLMDWKRFTRKSNKPGGRTSRTARTHTHTHTHTQRHTGQLEISSPAARNKQDSLFMYSPTAAPHCMTTTRLSKWVWMQSQSVDVLWPVKARSWKRRTILESFIQRLKVWWRRA